MKRITSLLLASITLALCSCSNPAYNARIGALTSLAVSYAEAKGKISPSDAAAIRAAQTIILPPSPTTSPPPGKAPLANLQP